MCGWMNEKLQVYPSTFCSLSLTEKALYIILLSGLLRPKTTKPMITMMEKDYYVRPYKEQWI